jgi:hypothetical protein
MKLAPSLGNVINPVGAEFLAETVFSPAHDHNALMQIKPSHRCIPTPLPNLVE